MNTFISNKSQTATDQITGISNERTYNQLEMELQKKKNEYRNGMETIEIRLQYEYRQFFVKIIMIFVD